MAAPNVRVNLLSDRKRLLKKRQLLVAKVQLIAGVLLAVYIALLLVVIGFRAAISAKLNRVENGIKAEELRISQLNQIEATFTIVENKLKLAGDFLEKRIELRKSFEKIVSLLPEGAILQSFSVDDNNNTVSVTIQAGDVYVAVALLDEFELRVENEDYEYVSVNNFSRVEDGSYNLRGVIPI